MSTLEFDDIQGIIIRGHSNMEAAEYLMLHFTDAARARQWLQEILPSITHAGEKPLPERRQIAFTHAGLGKLGLDLDATHYLRTEFIQGLGGDYRARLLGDLGDSAAENWAWGGPRNEVIHAVLMRYAIDQTTLQKSQGPLDATLADADIVCTARLDTIPNPMHKEHFGFRDGVSQPIIPGLKKSGTPGNPESPAGEFILGYNNAYHELPDSPLVPTNQDPQGILPTAQDSAFRDLGRNGSYMIFRQLSQDVKGFWGFIQEAVRKENPDAGPGPAIQLAAKMVGRWPSGCPITVSPEEDKPDLARENDFLYYEQDLEGFKCPVGSHVRRSNPRDSLQRNKPERAQRISQRHRILRRGRIYGAPLSPDFEPSSFLSAPDDGAPRGLHFICFNTDIARQFEFIQHTWNNNTKFEGMYEDPDPVLGIKDSRNKAFTHDFTIPAQPIRRKVQGLKRHVHVVGGAYFFMPGMRGLKYLAYMNSESS